MGMKLPFTKYSVRPVLVVNVFVITRPHAILEAACFGHILLPLFGTAHAQFNDVTRNMFTTVA